jgi:hypothetical protein
MTNVIKSNQTFRTLLILGVTLVTTLVLVLGTVALRVPGFSPLAFAHAIASGPTCASTKGTQQNLCEQQDPTEQGCANDAQSLEVETVYTNQNTLIGEVDLRHSATCKSYWVRTIAYTNATQVQAIEAIMSFQNGKTDDIQETTSSGQETIAVTHMLFVIPMKKTPTRKGVFHVQGQAQPIIIPL